MICKLSFLLYYQGSAGSARGIMLCIYTKLLTCDIIRGMIGIMWSTEPGRKECIMDIFRKCVATIDKYGKFAGIVLLVLSCICFFSDPPVVTIIFSLLILAGAVSCLIRRYKLKGFTIAAILITAFNLFAAIGQADEYGLFNRYPYEDVMGE